MSERTISILKAAGVGALVVIAAVLLASRLSSSGRIGEEGLSIWFYDESEQKLYAAPRDAIPPEKGIGGESGDGVRAVVVACPGEQDNAAGRRIAYLEKYTPEMKELLERVQAARSAGRVCEETIPPADSEQFQRSVLVRRAGESEWHDTTTPEAREIMSEWRGWRSDDGQPLIVCVP